MRIKVEFEVELPDIDFYSDNDIDDYLRFKFGDSNELFDNNPFEKIMPDVETVFGTFFWHQK